ncbi:arfaptin-2-like isoform X3 [Lineus longissimus]|uniref:arfaptin-2-like isoform X3 n=1 Tax=Lineus longissimus TaxID=88925 RepID=UPI00315D3DBF
MTDVSRPVPAANGANDDDDTFEQDLKDMLKDGPILDNNSSGIQDGNPHETESARIPTNLPKSTIPRSYTVPPALRALRNKIVSATTNVPLTSPQRNGEGNRPKKPDFSGFNASKLEGIKNWSMNTYKCTRQLISERLGKASRTVDLELESQIEVLRDTQRKYANILRLARALTSHFYHVVQTQRLLGDAFSDLAQKSPELQEEFCYNADTQRSLCKNGETLLGAMNFFTSGVNTLCNKTMEDTLTTIKSYETARIEYDAYRADLEALQLGPKDPTTQARAAEANVQFQKHKEKFDRLRGDVSIKLKFLEENKVKVMHKQLLLFHNAIAAYFSGNEAELEAVMKRFSIKLQPPNASTPSWLEQHE